MTSRATRTHRDRGSGRPGGTARGATGSIGRLLRAGFGVLVTLGLLVGGLAAPSMAAASLDLVKKLDATQEGGNTTDVFQVGGLVRYNLKVSCSSLTLECGTGTIVDVLDPNLDYVDVVKPQGADSTAAYDAATRTVTIVTGSEAKPFKGGDTLEFVLVTRVKSPGSDSDGDGLGEIPNQATATPKDGTPRTSEKVIIKVPQPVPTWGVDKIASNSSIAVGETVNYDVRLVVPADKLLGNVDVAGGILVDTYPEGAVVVDAGGGTVDTANRTITWIIDPTAVSGMNCSYYGGLCAGPAKSVKLQFPSPPFKDGDTAINYVRADVTYTNGQQETLRDEVPVTLVTPSTKVNFQKWGPANVGAGSTMTWTLYVKNEGSSTIPAPLVFEDAIPANVTNVQVSSWISEPWTLEAYKDGAWTTVGAGTGTPPPVPAGSEKFRLTVTRALAPNGAFAVYVNATAAGEPGSTVENCATAVIGGEDQAASCATTTITKESVRLQTGKFHKFNDWGASGVKPGDEFIWGIAAKQNGGNSVSKVNISDTLPPQFEYVSTECVVQMSDMGWSGPYLGSFLQATENCDPATAIDPTVTPFDQPEAGSTALVWKDVPLAGPAGGGAPITYVIFKVRVKPGTAVGTYTNFSYLDTDEADVLCPNVDPVKEPGDLDGDGDAGELVCPGKDSVIVQEASIIDLTKWDKGPLPNVSQSTGEESASCPDWDGFTRYPCVAQTPPDGSFEYRFKMQNVGNINVTDHVMYDILPHVGDTGVSQVLGGASRGTQWRPELTGPIVIESAPAAAAPVIEYNLTSNPCRPEVAQGANDANWQGGSCDDTWLTADAVTDWSAVKSFRIKSFQAGATWLPAEEIVLRALMHAPEDAQESVKEPLNLSIAWNSTAHRAFRQNADGSTERLLAAEPRKVGIIVPFPGVSIGDYVWLDSNRDGLQTNGEPGIDGVTVTLKKKDAAGEYQVVGTTTTSDGGYYYFQYLEPGKEYSVTFSNVPAGLVATTPNAGGVTSNSPTADPTDSDAIDGVIEFTTPTSGDNLAEPGKADNPGLDAGFHSDVEPLVSIGDYVWWDVNRDGQQSAGEPVVPGVTVNLYAADGTTLVRSTTTGTDGYYSFTGLTPSTGYVVEFVKPDGTSFTTQNTGDDASDSDADRTTGRVSVTTPASGGNSGEPTKADDPTIDAGLVRFNLVLKKELVAGGPYVKGATATFTLTPLNEGPSDALAGWSVTDLLPAELTLVSMSGTGYDCVTATATCVSASVLKAGQSGAPITVTATVDTNLSGTVRNVAYVAPHRDDVPETNPLGTPPTNATDTKTSPTDNDAEAELSVTALVSLGDYVWWDVNRDGQQTAGEPVVPGVTVNLYAADGTTLVRSTTTDTDGYYAFTGLTPSTGYVVEFVKPAGSAFTTQNTGDDASDSDADRTTGRVSVTTPASGGNSGEPTKADDPTIDAGLVKYNLVLRKSLTSTGTVYRGSTVTFQLTPSNDGPVDALAGWSVTDLLPEGLSLVSMSGTGYTCTVSTATCVAAAPLAAGASGAPITVTATVDTAFVGELVNVAYVAPAKDDIAETNPLVVPTRQTKDAPATRTAETPTDNDAEAPVTTDSLVSIGDYVWYDNDRDGKQTTGEPAVEGVTVNLYATDGTTLVATTTTDDKGFYSFGDLTPGREYVVEFVRPADHSFTLQNEGEDDAVDSDADRTTGRVTVVAPASGENSLTEPDDPTIDAGFVQLNLVLSKELVTAEKVYAGSEVVFDLTPTNEGPADALAGWSVTDLLPAGLTLVSMSGEGYTCTDNVCVAGSVLKAGEDGPTITVTATVGVGVKGVLHNVAYVAPNPGEIPETNPLEVPEGSTDTDETPTDNDDQADVTVTPLVSIGDYVWIDVDRDGVQDAGEPVVADVTVNLYEADGTTLVATTTTDDKGFYSFTDLKAGEKYVVEFVKPDGYTFTTTNSGDDDAADSDADPVTGRVEITAPLDGENSALTPDDPTFDAGLVRFNLTLTKTLVTSGVVHPGDTVTFSLVPHNDGPADSLGGWSVTDLLPEGLTLTGMSGTGYSCDLRTATCLAEAPLAAGADGAAITVTATVDAKAQLSMRNIAYVTPSPDDIDEDNPLVVPTKDTDTRTSPTDNDAEAPLTVTPAKDMPKTGADGMLPLAGLAGALLLLGGAFLVTRRRGTTVMPRHAA